MPGSGNAMDVVKTKVNELLASFPLADEQAKKLSEKIGVEKAFVALGVIAIPFIIMLSMGSGNFLL